MGTLRRPSDSEGGVCCKTGVGRRRSDSFDPDSLSVCSQGFEITRIGCEDGPSRFGDRNNQRVDR